MGFFVWDFYSLFFGMNFPIHSMQNENKEHWNYRMFNISDYWLECSACCGIWQLFQEIYPDEEFFPEIEICWMQYSLYLMEHQQIRIFFQRRDIRMLVSLVLFEVMKRKGKGFEPFDITYNSKTCLGNLRICLYLKIITQL